MKYLSSNMIRKTSENITEICEGFLLINEELFGIFLPLLELFNPFGILRVEYQIKCMCIVYSLRCKFVLFQCVGR